MLRQNSKVPCHSTEGGSHCEGTAKHKVHHMAQQLDRGDLHVRCDLCFPDASSPSALVVPLIRCASFLSTFIAADRACRSGKIGNNNAASCMYVNMNVYVHMRK